MRELPSGDSRRRQKVPSLWGDQLSKHSEANDNLPESKVTRRAVLAAIAGAGIGVAAFQRSLAVNAAQVGYVTPDMIREAEWVASIELTDAERRSAASRVAQVLRSFRAMHREPLSYTDAPAIRFSVCPATDSSHEEVVPQRNVKPIDWPKIDRPNSDDELAFLSLTELASLVRRRKISSVELTKFYLDRLRRYDPTLYCVMNLTESLAIKQAEKADREIAAGKIRGPLHGIPWGAKDLISVPGYPTTWGVQSLAKRELAEKATVATRLEEAGAVLVAKLAMGALAWGDEWYDKQTRNPWNPTEGSSGSSAGSASATAAGLVGFSIGTETLGSIVSPSRRCGTSGLRPTYGRVSRYGCMPLAWSMDKVGPIARTVEDCALIFAAIHGRDERDSTSVSRQFQWPPTKRPQDIRVGYFETDSPIEERAELVVLQELGYSLTPIEPPTIADWPLAIILDAEAAAVFDEMTRLEELEGGPRRIATLQAGRFIPAHEYLRANRIRGRLMAEMESTMSKVDVYVGGDDLVACNLTGHPTVVLPNGFRTTNEIKTPVGLTFTGRLFGETDLLAVAHSYQQATGFHREHPPVGKWVQ